MASLTAELGDDDTMLKYGTVLEERYLISSNKFIAHKFY
jgi:hypothetical protein